MSSLSPFSIETLFSEARSHSAFASDWQVQAIVTSVIHSDNWKTEKSEQLAPPRVCLEQEIRKDGVVTSLSFSIFEPVYSRYTRRNVDTASRTLLENHFTVGISKAKRRRTLIMTRLPD